MTWALRVEAYLLLLVDEYPPFSMQSDAPGAGGPGDSVSLQSHTDTRR